MATITIVIPAVDPEKFTGGILCLFEYARGLAARGHAVNILPMCPSKAPQWFDGEYGRFLGAPDPVNPRYAGRGNRLRRAARSAVVRGLEYLASRYLTPDMSRGLQIAFARDRMPDADVTVATAYETALPVHLYGRGRRAYFMQHYERLFAVDSPEPRLADYEAEASYRLGLTMIANSSWLQQKVQGDTGVAPELCVNAIDHRVYRPGGGRVEDGEVRVISYGGRHSTWKGFRDIAEAMRRTRDAMPHVRIRWQVYGDSLLPPDNPIAPYEPFGFLPPAKLADAYRQADILLSASWYESFPLYPLEAMACGIAVVTTQTGTEEFAHHGQTAEIVEARNVEHIAAGLQKVIADAGHRRTLAFAGPAMAQRFTWDASVTRMETLLLG